MTKIFLLCFFLLLLSSGFANSQSSEDNKSTDASMQKPNHEDKKGDVPADHKKEDKPNHEVKKGESKGNENHDHEHKDEGDKEKHNHENKKGDKPSHDQEKKGDKPNHDQDKKGDKPNQDLKKGLGNDSTNKANNVNGTSKEETAGFYELKKGPISVNLTNYGASIVSVLIPDKSGKLDDVVLGYDTIKEYMSDSTYFGALVGRVANRIGGAQFTLNGTQYKLNANEGKNTLHGGAKGFSHVIWKVGKYQKDGKDPEITFQYHSTDGEEGFPGDLDVSVTYSLMGASQLSVTMKAKALNKPTPVNLAQHTYWNLGGHNSGSILDHEVQIHGCKITPVDNNLIPTGKLEDVKGTPYDFLQSKPIGKDIAKLPKGYDINYALDGDNNKKIKQAAILSHPKTGRKMVVLTNQPGLQFYTGNMIKDVKGKGGVAYKQHGGLCLETQAYPDAVNHPNFPNTIVNPGMTCDHVMVYHFLDNRAFFPNAKA